MKFVNIHQAKPYFSHLINQALKGVEVVIAKNGIPLINLNSHKM
jgi:antitoxin (DNA-binding transcriptional repressor) of toxin-antitoxin stability system